VPLVVNGWTLLYHPVFGARYSELRSEVRRLKAALPPDEFVRHPLVKLVAAIRRLVLEIVPRDPDAPEFRLHAGLAKFRRAKGRGLPPRYRLFWVCSERARTIIFLYVNDQTTLRKEGARTDPYEVFKRMVERGEIGADFEANVRAWRQSHPPTPPE
jgi:toxin YhaV